MDSKGEIIENAEINSEGVIIDTETGKVIKDAHAVDVLVPPDSESEYEEIEEIINIPVFNFENTEKLNSMMERVPDARKDPIGVVNMI